jgi:hypothetical protein
VADIVELLWDDQNIAHIARHSVIPPEVEQVVFGDDAVFLDADTPWRPGRLVVLGRTGVGRHLAVYLDRPASGGAIR